MREFDKEAVEKAMEGVSKCWMRLWVVKKSGLIKNALVHQIRGREMNSLWNTKNSLEKTGIGKAWDTGQRKDREDIMEEDMWGQKGGMWK